MGWATWVAAGLAVLLGGWLVLDGTRAFIVGDYVTPASGEYAGKLGPWASLLEKLGVEPRSPAVKTVHIGLGLVWLAAAACTLARASWSGWLLAGCAVASLWYLPVGTLISLVELGLLLLPASRGS